MSHSPANYEIRIGCTLDDRWSSWFDGLTVASPADGLTVIAGWFADQAALHGVLERIRDLGLPLESVQRAPRTDSGHEEDTIMRSPPTENADAVESTDPDCLRPADAEALLRGVSCHRLVVIGDSVAAGVREPVPGYRDSSFAERIRDAFDRTRPAFAYRNLAVRDLRLPEIRETQLEPALDFGADLALIAGGGNDALRRSFDESRVRADLLALAGPFADRGTRVVTIGMFDLARSGLVPEERAADMARRFDRLDEITAGVAAGLGGIHVDCHHHPRAADPAIFARDRIHANARGHAIAAAEITAALADSR